MREEGKLENRKRKNLETPKPKLHIRHDGVKKKYKKNKQKFIYKTNKKYHNFPAQT